MNVAAVDRERTMQVNLQYIHSHETLAGYVAPHAIVAHTHHTHDEGAGQIFGMGWEQFLVPLQCGIIDSVPICPGEK